MESVLWWTLFLYQRKFLRDSEREYLSLSSQKFQVSSSVHPFSISLSHTLCFASWQDHDGDQDNINNVVMSGHDFRYQRNERGGGKYI